MPVDIGSGVGRAMSLVHLLSGAAVIGLRTAHAVYPHAIDGAASGRPARGAAPAATEADAIVDGGPPVVAMMENAKCTWVGLSATTCTAMRPSLLSRMDPARPPPSQGSAQSWMVSALAAGERRRPRDVIAICRGERERAAEATAAISAGSAVSTAVESPSVAGAGIYDTLAIAAAGSRTVDGDPDVHHVRVDARAHRRVLPTGGHSPLMVDPPQRCWCTSRPRIGP